MRSFQTKGRIKRGPQHALKVADAAGVTAYSITAHVLLPKAKVEHRRRPLQQVAVCRNHSRHLS